MKTVAWLPLAVLPGLVACSGSSGSNLAPIDGGDDVAAAGHDATSDDASGPDATTEADASVDATMEADASVDATTQADSSVDATTEADSSVDATMEADGSTDASAAGDADGALEAGSYSLSFGAPTVVSTAGEREGLGFRFGYVDGVLGAIHRGDAGYTFYVSAHTEPPEAGTCTGAHATPNTQGAYRIGVDPTDITTNYGCEALIANSGDVAPDGSVLGAYDRDYVGAGPVFALHNGASVAHGLIYHAEFHWGPTCNGAPCFYGTLGLAFSTDSGVTFTKYGEIVQPAIARPDWIAGHAGSSLSIGAGPFVFGDADGAPVDPTSADPATTYLYVYFDDFDPTNAAPCANSQCLTVARASMQDLTDAAFGNAGAKPASQLFSKYLAGSTGLFGSPAASGSADDSTAGGHETAILPATFEASTLYDRTLQKFLLAYRSESTAIHLRTSSSAFQWPDAEVVTDAIDEDAGVRYPSLMGDFDSAEVGGTSPYVFYTNGVDTWPTSTFMVRRIVLTPK
jgi:hypothetical protein